MKSKIGVLVVNLGTPDDPSTGSVRRYLREFLMDGRVVDYNVVARSILVNGIIAPFRAPKSAKAYKELWTENGSPLKYYGEVLVSELQKIMPDNYCIRLAMRYQNPSILSQVEDLILKEKVDKIVVMPLFPQYASATTGSIHEEVMRILSKKRTLPALNLIHSYPENETMVKIFADNARKMGYQDYDHYLFSYHGVPARQIRESDPFQHCKMDGKCCGSLNQDNKFCYSAQCNATSRAIAKELGLEETQYSISFQSRLGPEAWLKPYTVDTIEALAQSGVRKLLVFSPAFVADCLETTIEIDEEYKEEFEEKFGGERLDLVPSLNDDPRWIDTVKEIILENS
jgi:protoporphyrin/coproporphyrin ferrochelatase